MKLEAPPSDWSETIAPNEDVLFAGYAEQIVNLQREAAAKSGKTMRALHPKALIGARAKFTVLPDLPEFARVGLFAEPKTFAAWVRFSNGSPRLQSDKKGDIRGFVVKVLGVPGKKVIPGLENKTTQDFSMIHAPVIPFRDAGDFMFFVSAGANPLTLLPKMIGRFGFGQTFKILGSLKNRYLGAVPTLAKQRFWSALPIKFGPYAIHYSAKPCLGANETALSSSGADYLGSELTERLKIGPVEYDFMIQFYRDAEKTPTEDASVEWLESESEFITVAKIVIPQQDVNSEEGKKNTALIDNMSFDPWHALEEFRPLGNVMRARGPAYKLSTEARKATPEPD